MRSIIFISSFLCLFTAIHAQHDAFHSSSDGITELSHKNWRVAGLIGHTLIKTEAADAYVFVPSWGLDIEYWFSHKIGLGLHNDLEIESFLIETDEGEEIERVNPLVITLDLLYHINDKLVLNIGPGIEVEPEESYNLLRVGLEMEYPIGNGWDVFPMIVYDHRFNSYATWSFGLGVGKMF